MITSATLGVRLIALLLISVSLWQGMANIAESLGSFDPNYLGHYFTTQLLRPGTGILLGFILMVWSKRLGRWLSPAGE